MLIYNMVGQIYAGFIQKIKWGHGFLSFTYSFISRLPKMARLPGTSNQSVMVIKIGEFNKSGSHLLLRIDRSWDWRKAPKMRAPI